jgi:hypothetical protein
MYSGGYTGKVLRVDLTSRTFSEELLPEAVARDFIGGAGFTVKYLFDEVPADFDQGRQRALPLGQGPLGPRHERLSAGHQGRAARPERPHRPAAVAGRAGAEMPMEMGMSLMLHSSQEWFYLMRFLPALFIAERRDETPAPVAW